ncbi:hypothetical protein LB505_011716 [Fusarium chuoi]|nr:hypothetical protein LB505_011716 [Fusarium chuoi]
MSLSPPSSGIRSTTRSRSRLLWMTACRSSVLSTLISTSSTSPFLSRTLELLLVRIFSLSPEETSPMVTSSSMTVSPLLTHGREHAFDKPRWDVNIFSHEDEKPATHQVII